MAYPLIDLQRLGIYVKEYVYRLEQARDQDAGRTSASPATACAGAPGIYVRLDDPFGHAALRRPARPGGDPFDGLGKIAALGIKVSRHCTYHGVALNVAMDLRPFERHQPLRLRRAGRRSTFLQSAFAPPGTRWRDAWAHKLAAYLAP